MHEMSIAQEICGIARDTVGEDEVSRVVTVGVEVGSDSGVEADNLLFWLEILLKEDPFEGATPVLERVEGDSLRVSYMEVKDAGPED